MDKHTVLEPTNTAIPAGHLTKHKASFISDIAAEILAFFDHEMLDQTNAKNLYSFGYALYQQSRFAEATQTFTYLLLYAKADSKVLMALGACYQLQSDFETAAKFYHSAIQYKYLDPSVHLNLAECLLRLNKKTDAINQLKLAAIRAHGSLEHLDTFQKASGLMELVEQSFHAED